MADTRVRDAAAIGALLFGAHLLRFADTMYAADDAWIVFRVARNWLATGVPAFDLTRPVVEGATSPMWTVLSAAFGEDPIGPARVLGGLFGILAVFLAARAAGSVRGAAGVGMALAACGGLAFHAVNGLETGLWVMLVVIAALGHRSALFLLPWCRPEGVLVGLIAARDRRGLALLALGAVTVGAWRWFHFGALVPNTFLAKPPAPAQGLAYVGAWVVALGGAPVLALFTRRWRWIALVGVTAAGVAWSGGDWMPGQRRLAEASVLVALALGSSFRKPGVIGLVAMILGGLTAAWRGMDHAAYYHGELAAVGALAAQTTAITRIAAFDIGRLGWVFPGSIYDLAGLTDARLARRPGAHGQKGWDSPYFDRQSPELVLLTGAGDPAHPVFINAEQAAWDALNGRGDYELLGPVAVGRDHLFVLVREDVVLPPEVWAGWEERVR